MNYNKYFILFCILLFVGSRIFLIAEQFSDTRIIEVRKEIYESNEKENLKNYTIVNAPFEQFDLQVTPKDFWDYLSLTNVNGNLISISLEIIAACFLAVYIYKISYGDIFPKNGFKWAKWSVLLILLAGVAHFSGLNYTRDFWDSLYVSHIKGWRKEFYVETKYGTFLYYIVFCATIAFIKEYMDYYEDPDKYRKGLFKTESKPA